MTYAQLLHTIPEGLRKLFRQYENLAKKLSNTKWSVEFQSTCLKEYIYIYIYVCVCIHTYIYIYIYIERERERLD